MQPTDSSTSRGALLEAAVRLFSRKWFAVVSVAEICREAGVSNGLFYRYFRDKETIFREILESVIEAIARVLESVDGGSREERVASFIRNVAEFSVAHRELVSIFREGQYRFFEYEKRLTALFVEAVSRLTGRNAELPEYLFAAAGLRFCSVRGAFHGTPFSYDAAAEIVLHGVFRDVPEPRWDRVFEITVRPLPISLEESTRERLLRAGKKLFGERSFHDVNIHEITGSLEIAVGSFYTHFPSKEAFYADVIELVNAEIRHFITSNLDRSLTRLEQELQGVYLFSFFLSLDRYCYPIIREAEFVLPEKVRAYYDAFQDGYLRNLTGIGGLDPSTAANWLMGVSHYLGIEVVFEDSPKNVRAVVRALGGLLARGLPVR